MELAYGRGSYRRSRGNLPELPVINMIAEASRSEQRGVVMQSRRGLVEDDDVGDGPIRGVFEQDGVFAGSRFVVSDDGFYRDGTLLGTIDGTGVVYIVGIDGEVLVTAGESLWSYDGIDFVAVTFPDSANVTAIGYAAGYFIALRELSDRWYFSTIDDGRTWDGLDFATAESEPDQLLDLTVIDGNPVFFGASSVEFWAATGDATIPFAPVQQRTFEQGVFATGCVAQEDNSFFWVGSDRVVYRNGEAAPAAISDDGIVERLLGSNTIRLWTVTDERHKLIMARGDDFTMVFDITSGEWSEFQSYGRDNFRAGPGMGDDETGQIWRFEGYTDNGGVLERRIRAGAQLDEPAIIDRLRVSCEVGTTGYLTGDYADPRLEMRYSDDAGNTWATWETEYLGAQGAYRSLVEWRALGMFDHPGMLFELRVTDPVSWRLSGIQVNTSGGGRGR